MSEARTIRILEFGGPEVLTLETTPLPAPGRGGVHVRRSQEPDSSSVRVATALRPVCTETSYPGRKRRVVAYT